MAEGWRDTLLYAMSKSWLIVLGVLIALVVAGVVLLENLKFTNPAASRNSDISSAQVSKEQDQTSEGKVEVAASEYSFTPQTISLKKGVLAEIVLKNTGTGTHNLVIPDLNVETESVGPGEETSVEVTPNKTGEFSFDCGVANHKELGMTGQVVVE